MKNHLSWTILASIVTIATFGFTLPAYVKSLKRKVSVSIGDHVIKCGEQVNVYYLLPKERIRCGETSGFLPIELTKGKGSNTENILLYINARPYIKKETSVATARLCANASENPVYHSLPGYVHREYSRCDTVLWQERVLYQIEQLNPQCRMWFLEKFSIDTTRAWVPDAPYYTPVEDYFSLKISCSRKDKGIESVFPVNLFILNYSSLEQMAADCKAIGTLTWGRVARYPAPEAIHNLIVRPGYESDGAISLDATEVYSFEHEQETFFHKRRFTIRDRNGKIVKRYRFDDSEEIRAFFKRYYDSFDKEQIERALRERQSASRS